MIEPTADQEMRYTEQGWWDGSTLQGLLEHGVRSSAAAELRVHSAVRPYAGSIGDVATLASGLAGGLQDAGLRKSAVVAFQLPNWMEAVAAFWALSAAGVILVPIPHSYGPHEARHILLQTGARAIIIADQFGERNYLAEYEAIRSELPALERIIVVGESSPLPPWATPFNEMLSTSAPAGVQVRPEDPAVIGYTSGTGASPKGVILSHRCLAFEVRSHMVPSSRELKPLL